MSEQEQAKRLEQKLREGHLGRTQAGADTEQQALLEVAASLYDPGFHPTNNFQERLYEQIAARSTAIYAANRRKQQVKYSLGFVFKSAAWIGAAALLVLALTWAIQNQIGAPSQPQPAAIVQPTADTVPGPEEAAGFRLEAGKVVEVEDGYVIPLRIVPLEVVNAWVTLPVEPKPVRMFGGDVQMPFVMTDASGELLNYEIHEYPADGVEEYSYKLSGKAIEWPVTIALGIQPMLLIPTSVRSIRWTPALNTGPGSSGRSTRAWNWRDAACGCCRCSRGRRVITCRWGAAACSQWK
jgi:hypothetical protein